MKKDFTQSFVTKPATIFLLLQHETSGEFFVHRSLDEDKENDGYYAEDFYVLPTITANKDGYTLELTKQLFSWGLSPTMYQELVRATQLEYSFSDETPGSAADMVYLHALVDAADKTNNKLVTLAFNELTSRLEDGPLLSRALTQLRPR